MQTVCVVTGTRAEYGLLKPLIVALRKVEIFKTTLVVTGTHLSSEFGLTFNEIEQDGITIDEKIAILLSSDTPSCISKTMGMAMISFGEYFERSKPDILIVLGDRYELLAVCCAAANARIPIVHVNGGDTTEGAIDEAYRHSITKMSYLHFVSTEVYRKRVIQLGESPERVYTVGALGIENTLSVPLMTLAELEESISFKLDVPYAVVTFHPVVLENNTAAAQIDELLRAIRYFTNMRFIFTKANGDAGGRIINSKIEEFTKLSDNSILVDSLGVTRYLSAVKHSSFVIGNSSSGIVEAPTLGVPTINIGDRQKGRIQAESIINCLPERDEIVKSIEKALSIEFKEKTKNTVNPYGDGKTSVKIVSILKEYLYNKNINLKKRFHDVDFEVTD